MQIYLQTKKNSFGEIQQGQIYTLLVLDMHFYDKNSVTVEQVGESQPFLRHKNYWNIRLKRF